MAKEYIYIASNYLEKGWKSLILIGSSIFRTVSFLVTSWGGGYDTSLDIYMQKASQYACDRGLITSVVDMISHGLLYQKICLHTSKVSSHFSIQSR